MPPPINRTHQIQPVGSLSNTDAIIHSCSLFVATKWQRCQCQCQCHQYSNQHDHFKWFGIGARLLPFWPDHHQVKNPFKGIAIVKKDSLCLKFGWEVVIDKKSFMHIHIMPTTAICLNTGTSMFHPPWHLVVFLNKCEKLPLAQVFWYWYICHCTGCLGLPSALQMDFSHRRIITVTHCNAYYWIILLNTIDTIKLCYKYIKHIKDRSKPLRLSNQSPSV